MKNNLEKIGLIIGIVGLLIAALTWLMPFNSVGKSPFSSNNKTDSPPVNIQIGDSKPNITVLDTYSTDHGSGTVTTNDGKDEYECGDYIRLVNTGGVPTYLKSIDVMITYKGKNLNLSVNDLESSGWYINDIWIYASLAKEYKHTSPIKIEAHGTTEIVTYVDVKSPIDKHRLLSLAMLNHGFNPDTTPTIAVGYQFNFPDNEPVKTESSSCVYTD